jgi:futalosine hydrolase
MNRLLLVVSTEFEIQPFLDDQCILTGSNVYTLKSNSSCDVMITGIGIANMTLQLSRYLSFHKVNQALNVGFCGSFQEDLELGKPVSIESDVFAELGVLNEQNDIIPFEEMKIGKNILKDMNLFVRAELPIVNSMLHFQVVRGITVSACTNNDFRAQMMKKRYSAQVESMEGAAFFLTCNSYGVACSQIRAVSNHIPGRAPDRWNVEKAQQALCRIAGEVCSL